MRVVIISVLLVGSCVGGYFQPDGGDLLWVAYGVVMMSVSTTAVRRYLR